MIHPDLCPVCGRKPPVRSLRTATLAVLTVSCPLCAGPLTRDVSRSRNVVVTPAVSVLESIEAGRRGGPPCR